MTIWEADFYRRPLRNAAGQPLWELLLCDQQRQLILSAMCPQPDATAAWLTGQLRSHFAAGVTPPERLRVFRPQSLSLLQVACEPLGIAVEGTRRTPAIKAVLLARASAYAQMPEYSSEAYQPLYIEKAPPAPLPETLWGDRWRFGAMAAGDLISVFRHRPVPILEMPTELLPVQLGLASTTPIPGVILEGGRRSLQIARWLQTHQPVSLHYRTGDPDGLILEAGLSDRWVIATTTDPDMAAAARTYEERQQASQGLHFLLIEPDDSGQTSTAFWLLRPDPFGS